MALEDRLIKKMKINDSSEKALDEDLLKNGTVGKSSVGTESSDINGGERRGQDSFHILDVTLEELYTGAKRMVKLPRYVLCKECNGKGTKFGACCVCQRCLGSGVKIFIYNKGSLPVPHLDWEYPCQVCWGTGEDFKPDVTCPTCSGKKISEVFIDMPVLVLKGMHDGQKIILPNMVDQALPASLPGDMVVVIKQMEHPWYKRKGDHLFFEHRLSLREAFCGFEFVLTHLDGRKLLIKSRVGEVVRPGQFMAIHDEGMPLYCSYSEKGKLYIHFIVDFPRPLKYLESKAMPKSLNTEQVLTLKSVLPEKAISQKMDQCDTVATEMHNVGDLEKQMFCM